MEPSNTVLVAALAVLVMLAVAVVYYRTRNSAVERRVARTIDTAIDRLGAATQQYTETNAVLALTQQLESRPDLAAELAQFSRSTVAATLMVRINGVAADIKMVQVQLSEDRRSLGKGYTSFQAKVAHNEQLLAKLQTELRALDELNQAYSRSHLTAV